MLRVIAFWAFGLALALCHTAAAVRLSGVACACLGCACLLASVCAHRARWGRAALGVVSLAVAVSWRLAALPPPVPAASCAAESLWRVRLVGPVDRAVGPGASTRSQLRVRAQLLAQACGNQWASRQGIVMLRLDGATQVARGDLLQVPLQVDGPPLPRNAGDLPVATWMQRSGLCGRATVRGPAMVLARSKAPWAHLDSFRQRASRRFEATLPKDSAALAKAMVLGDTASLGPEIRDVWAAAGTAHLLAVSGLHVGLVMGLAQWVVRSTLGFSPWAIHRWHVPRLGQACGLLLGSAFALLTGSGWAALRATAMAACLAVGRLGGQRQAGLQALGAVGLVLLWWQPTAAWDAGFSLSFAAVAGLLIYVPAPAAVGAPTVPPVGRWRGALGRALATCAAAGLATAPVCSVYFGRLSALAALVNVVAVPLGAWVAVPFGLLHVLVAGQGGAFLHLPLAAALRLLAQLTAWAAAVPGATLWAPPIDALQGLAWGGLLAAAAGWRRWPTAAGRQLSRCWALAWAALCGLLWAYAASGRNFKKPGLLQVEHLYVGQGDATLVTLPHGGRLLVDGGGALHADAPDPGRRDVAAALRHRGVRRLDVILLTHPHPDHLNGLVYIAQHFAVGALWLNGDLVATAALQALGQHVAAQGGRIEAPPHHVVWQGVQLTTYQPLMGTAASVNDRSVALHLQYDQRSIFLAGDLEGRGEAAVATRLGPTDILKVAHHGSRTSSTVPLLQVLRPKVAVISCGDNNTFGFPHPEALARLHACGAHVLRTDTAGAVHLTTDGQTWQVAQALASGDRLPSSASFGFAKPTR